MTKLVVYVQLRGLWQAAIVSIARARSRGLSTFQILKRALSALHAGPRGFARQVVRYSSVSDVASAAVAVGEAGEYRQWLGMQLQRWIPAASVGSVSVVMPACNTPPQFLQEAYQSLCAQTYEDWVLCIHDDASDVPWARPSLERLAAADSRVRVSYGRERGGIARATNAALALADGRWVAFLDHDDVLHPDALAATTARLTADRSQLVYTDHDAINEQGERCAPYFKPDWSPDLFLSQMYLGHLVVIERELVARVGGLRPETDGAQDYDLFLRCVAEGAKVSHVPQVLYHWRQHSGSTSMNAASKPYAHHAGRRALQDYVDVRYPGARVDNGAYTFCYDVRYARGERALASIVIPTRDRIDLLDVCVSTLHRLTVDQPYEILILDNGSVEPETHEWFARACLDPRVRVIPADVPFNWSALNNIATRQARGDVLVFLNNDTEVIDGQWLERLVEISLRDDTGVCGPLLLYGDGTIQHAGVVVGMGGWADHVFKGQAPVHHQHLFTSPMMRRNVLAVTGACMAIEKRKFDALGCFDESFVVCGSDVELCLRARKAGLLNVYVPEARLVHHESKTRDPHAIPDSDFVRSEEAYRPYRTEGDPFYSPNLDPMSASPVLKGRL
jgi:GT2 family glycosyltransferase